MIMDPNVAPTIWSYEQVILLELVLLAIAGAAGFALGRKSARKEAIDQTLKQ